MAKWLKLYAVLLKHKKISGQPAHVWQWHLGKKVVVTVCPLYVDSKSDQSGYILYCCIAMRNKVYRPYIINPVLGNNNI